MINFIKDFLLRNKIIKLEVRLNNYDEHNILWNALYDIEEKLGNLNRKLETNSIDMTMFIRCKYSTYRKIIRRLQKDDRTIMYDPKTKFSYLIISVK